MTFSLAIFLSVCAVCVTVIVVSSGLFRLQIRGDNPFEKPEDVPEWARHFLCAHCHDVVRCEENPGKEIVQVIRDDNKKVVGYVHGGLVPRANANHSTEQRVKREL